MSNSNSLPPIQTFAESRQLDNITNFLSFSDSIISITRGYGLEGYIDGSIPRPASNVAPAVLAAGAVAGQPGRNTLRCSNCNRRGHSRAMCYAIGGGSYGQAPPNWVPPAGMANPPANNRPPQAQAAALSTVVDMGTDVSGMASFYALATKADIASFRPSGEASPILKDSVSESVQGSAVPYPYQFVLASINGSSSSSPFPTFLDSAASECCIRDRRFFVTFTEKKAQGRMATNDSSGKFSIEGFGIVQIKVKNSNGSVRTLRMAALYTPSFAMNLLSIPAFDSKGFVGSWGSGVLSVKDPRSGEVIVDGKLAVDRGSHRLYQ
ncbi:hypothetical protein EV360DRAFT_76678, partial [Lentinula raphanica]